MAGRHKGTQLDVIAGVGACVCPKNINSNEARH